MTRWLLVAALFCSGCANALPPHVWMPLKRVEGVDFFWWTATKTCQIRVVWDEGDRVKAQTVSVDPAVCLEKLKGLGYAVPAQETAE